MAYISFLQKGLAHANLIGPPMGQIITVSYGACPEYNSAKST